METWRYKGHLITHKNRQKDGRWLSSAKYRTPNGKFRITAYQSGFEGFDTEDEAQEATANLVREQIDKSGVANLFSLGAKNCELSGPPAKSAPRGT
jgi:hypothetical protein